MTITREIARAAATDAANSHAEAHGRTAWNEDDYNVAVRIFLKLWPEGAA